jgi:hypothetical protein
MPNNCSTLHISQPPQLLWLQGMKKKPLWF